MAAPKTGRKHRLEREPKLGEKIAELIRTPMPKKAAAAKHKVSETRFYEWLRMADAHDAPAYLVAFKEEIEAAEADVLAEFVGVIDDAGTDRVITNDKGNTVGTVEGDWRATAWLAERMFPYDLGNRVRHEHVGEGGGPIDFEVSTDKATQDAARALLEKLGG